MNNTFRRSLATIERQIRESEENGLLITGPLLEIQEQINIAHLSGNRQDSERLMMLVNQYQMNPYNVFAESLGRSAEFFRIDRDLERNFVQPIFSSRVILPVLQTEQTHTINTPARNAPPINTRFNIAHSGSGERAQETAKESLRKLQARYPNCNLTQNIEEINDYLNNLPEDTPEKSALKQNAIACFLFIQSCNHYYPLSSPQISFVNGLALVWEGIKNVPEGNYVKSYKEGLAQNLNAAYLTYPDREASISCPPGIFTRYVSTLNYGHPDVFVDTTGSAIADANESVLVWVTEALAKKDLAIQETILSTWDNNDASNTTFVSQFRQEIINLIAQKLTSVYGALLSEQDHSDIINNLEYLPKPTNEALQIQREKIENNQLNSVAIAIQTWANAITTESNVNRNRQAAIQRFCDYITQLQNQHITCLEKLHTLQSTFSIIKKLDHFAQNLLTISHQHKWNKKRQQQVDTMISTIQATYVRCSTIENLNDLQAIYDTFKTDIATLKGTVSTDHRETGRLHIFGSFQPESRLKSLMENELISAESTISP